MAAAALLDGSDLERFRTERYAGWGSELGQSILGGAASLDSLYDRQLGSPEPQPVSGRQELLEAIVARTIERVR